MGEGGADPAEMIGLGGGWARVAPAELIRAYLLLASAPPPAGAADLLSRDGSLRAIRDRQGS